MWYELKFGLIGFAVGTIAISATTFASNIAGSASPEAARPPTEAVALAPVLKPLDVSATLNQPQRPAPATPMSAWRRAYIARHGHQPPAPAA